MKITLYPLNLKLNQAFEHSAHKRQCTESLLLKIEDEEGNTGIGECAPRLYVTGETITSVCQKFNDEILVDLLKTIDYSTTLNTLNSLNAILDVYFGKDKALNSRCLLELAFLDLIGKKFKCSIRELLAGYYALPDINSAHFFKTCQVLDFSLSTQTFLKSRGPFHYIKIKVDNNLLNNIQRISAVRAAVGPLVPIIVDANMAWTLDEAMIHSAKLKIYHIDYYEEPFKQYDFEAYQIFRKMAGEKILLDESVCFLKDAKKAIAAKACDAFNVRVSKNGGLMNAIEIIQLAKVNHLKFYLGAQVAEVGPLIAAGRHLRALFDDCIAFEAGQPDRQFSKYLIDPMPLVDRKTNYAYETRGFGLGVVLNNIEG